MQFLFMLFVQLLLVGTIVPSSQYHILSKTMSISTMNDTLTATLPSKNPSISNQDGSLIHGTAASVYLQPSGLPKGSVDWRTVKGHGGIYTNDTWWETYMSRRDSDVDILKRSLAEALVPSVIIFFSSYLADEAVWG